MTDTMKLAWYEDGVMKTRAMSREEFARMTLPALDLEWPDLDKPPIETLAAGTKARYKD